MQTIACTHFLTFFLKFHDDELRDRPITRSNQASFDFDKAKVNYHQSLAALHNADDVLVAVVKIVDEYGNNMDEFREVVDHTPKPEPEPTPEEETEEPVE